MDELRGLWRGKRIDGSGAWVEGLLEYRDYELSSAQLYNENNCEDFWVDPSTLGECTGLHDKNGKLIFEGDIVQVNHPYNGKSIHKVIWDEYCWNLKGFYASCYDAPQLAFSEGTTYMTVIGNIHDNPELLNDKQEV